MHLLAPPSLAVLQSHVIGQEENKNQELEHCQQQVIIQEENYHQKQDKNKEGKNYQESVKNQEENII